MTLPTDTARICSFLIGRVLTGINPTPPPFQVTTIPETRIASWDESRAGRPQPTDAEIIDASNDLTLVNGKVYSTWDAENGGDAVLTRRRLAAGRPEENTSTGYEFRQHVELHNKRDNRILQLAQAVADALLAMKATSGGADNLRAAIPDTFPNVQPRTRAEAIEDYQQGLNDGESDYPASAAPAADARR